MLTKFQSEKLNTGDHLVSTWMQIIGQYPNYKEMALRHWLAFLGQCPAVGMAINHTVSKRGEILDYLWDY